MKASPPKQAPFRRSTPLQHRANTKSKSEKAGESLNDGLAICLVGFSRTMYDSEYEEEVRKQAVMSEVLPDAEMWRKWEKTEAPLRQGRGWYPALDRHFLELLVISEIHCLAHPMYGLQASPGEAERIHRHASRVRRVACERIGAERLHAYCERVKEAYEAYMHGGWSQPPLRTASSDSDELETDAGDDDDDGGRGRSKAKGDGSVVRDVKPEDVGGTRFVRTHVRNGGDGDDPFADTVMGDDDSVATRLGSGDEGELLKIDLDDVQETDESGEEKESRSSAKEDMEVDPVPFINLPDPDPGDTGTPDIPTRPPAQTLVDKVKDKFGD